MTWWLEIQHESHSQALVRAALMILPLKLIQRTIRESSLAITASESFSARRLLEDTKMRTREKEQLQREQCEWGSSLRDMKV